MSNQMDSTGSDSYRLCYKWNVQFLTSRDVLLTLRITTLAGNMSLQIIKYTGNTGGDLQGQTHGNMTGVSVKVAFANCTGVGVKVVANTFCSNGSHIKTAYVGFVTVSDPPKDGKVLVMLLVEERSEYLSSEQFLASHHHVEINCPLFYSPKLWVIVVTVRAGLKRSHATQVS